MPRIKLLPLAWKAEAIVLDSNILNKSCFPWAPFLLIFLRHNKTMTIKNISIIAGAISLSLISIEIASAQFVSPNRGQSAAQQSRDESDCSTIANRQAGGSTPSAGSNIIRGSARGAALGAVGGAVFGNAGTGAGAGAAMGAVGGIFRTHDQSTASTNAFNQAFAACMEGRGYTVRF